jgi:hypothetical protein
MGDGEVCDKSLEMRHFQVFTHPEKPELAASWAAGVARMEKMRETAPTEEAGCIMASGQQAKTGILVYTNQLGVGQPVSLFSKE